MSKVVVSISCRPFFIQKIFIGNVLCPCIILSAMVNMELSKLYSNLIRLQPLLKRLYSIVVENTDFGVRQTWV